MFDNDPNTWMVVGGIALALFILYTIVTTPGLGMKFIIALVIGGAIAVFIALGIHDFLTDLIAPFMDGFLNFDIAKTFKGGKL